MLKVQKPKINLSIYGCLRAVENTVSEVAAKFDWSNAIADAAILASLTFFGALGGTLAVGTPTLNAVVAALIAAGTQFGTILAMKRKLIKE